MLVGVTAPSPNVSMINRRMAQIMFMKIASRLPTRMNTSSAHNATGRA